MKRYIDIYKIIKIHIIKFTIGLTIIIIFTILSILDPYILKQIVDISVTGKDFMGIIKYSLILLMIFIIGKILYYTKSYIFTDISQKILYDLRIKVFSKIINEDLSFFNQRKIGEIISKISNESSAVADLIEKNIVYYIIDFTTLLFVLTIMLSMNVEITVFSFVVALISYFILKHYNPKFKNINKELMMNYAKMNETVHENLTNIKLIKYMRLQEFSTGRFSTVLLNNIKSVFKQLNLTIFCDGYLSTLYFIPSVIVILYGGYLAVNGRLSLGSLVALLSYVKKIFEPVRSIVNNSIDIQRGIVAFDNLREYLVDIDKIENKIILGNINKGLYIYNVDFAYGNSRKIFSQFDLHISVGSKLQIIGDNGAGKTTLIDLLFKLIEPQKGYIKYDDIEMSYIDDSSFSDLITIVPQYAYLFSDSVRNNIILDKDVSDQKIMELVKSLGLSERFDEKFNLDTLVSNSGSNLSGGQRQILSIIRALLRDTQILVLDEPFTFLDDSVKRYMKEYILNAAKEKIIILISHDNTISFDDTVNITAGT